MIYNSICDLNSIVNSIKFSEEEKSLKIKNKSNVDQ